MDSVAAEGLYFQGKKAGIWTEKSWDGLVQEGPYLDGRKHGRWIVRAPEAHESIQRWVEQWASCYEHGKSVACN